jgi:hypothetical protein
LAHYKVEFKKQTTKSETKSKDLGLFKSLNTKLITY